MENFLAYLVNALAAGVFVCILATPTVWYQGLRRGAMNLPSVIVLLVLSVALIAVVILAPPKAHILPLRSIVGYAGLGVSLLLVAHYFFLKKYSPNG